MARTQGTQRRAMVSPLGTYVGRAVVVKHEDGVALSLWHMKHTATGSYPIRNAARFIPQNWHASTAMIGTVLDVSLTRESPRVSRLNTFAVVEDAKASYGGDDAKTRAHGAVDERMGIRRQFRPVASHVA